MRRRILMCLAVLLLLSGMGAASASDVLAAQSEALDLDALQDAAGGYLPDGALEADHKPLHLLIQFRQRCIKTNQFTV